MTCDNLGWEPTATYALDIFNLLIRMIQVDHFDGEDTSGGLVAPDETNQQPRELSTSLKHALQADAATVLRTEDSRHPV